MNRPNEVLLRLVERDGRSHREIAKDAGLSNSMVSKICKGGRTVCHELARTVARNAPELLELAQAEVRNRGTIPVPADAPEDWKWATLTALRMELLEGGSDGE